MASNKRQRKKTNQAARRAALEAARKRQQRKRQLLNLGGLVLGVLVLALLVVFIAGRGGDDVDTAASTTTSSVVALTTLPPVPAGRDVTGATPCPNADDEARASRFERPPPLCIDPTKAYQAVFATSAGVIKVNLDAKRTPLTVNNFAVLAWYGYYDGSSFPRTDPSIDIIQGGSPSTQSIADPGPGYNIKDEGGKFTYSEGDLVMARTEGPDSAGAQFFFSAGPKTSQLDSQGTYVTFGKVVEGLDVLKRVLASHVDCPEESSRGESGSCLGGAPQPPVEVSSVTVDEV